MIQTYTCGKDMKVMVWAAFWDTGRTQLYIIDRDFESKKHRYSANSYLEVLTDQVLFWHRRLDKGYVFIQDNASIHTAKKVKAWFKKYGITTTDWPPYSPDLNPIENAWWELKKRVFQMFPEVMACRGNSEEDRQRLESCLQAAWDTIPKEFFDALIESMPRRVAACIAADGWHTKY
jgi:transposase